MMNAMMLAFLAAPVTSFTVSADSADLTCLCGAVEESCDALPIPCDPLQLTAVGAQNLIASATYPPPRDGGVADSGPSDSGPADSGPRDGGAGLSLLDCNAPMQTGYHTIRTASGQYRRFFTHEPVLYGFFGGSRPVVIHFHGGGEQAFHIAGYTWGMVQEEALMIGVESNAPAGQQPWTSDPAQNLDVYDAIRSCLPLFAAQAVPLRVFLSAFSNGAYGVPEGILEARNNYAGVVLHSGGYFGGGFLPGGGPIIAVHGGPGDGAGFNPQIDFSGQAANIVAAARAAGNAAVLCEHAFGHQLDPALGADNSMYRAFFASGSTTAFASAGNCQ